MKRARRGFELVESGREETRLDDLYVNLESVFAGSRAFLCFSRYVLGEGSQL